MSNNQNNIESSVVSKDSDASQNVESFFSSAEEIIATKSISDNKTNNLENISTIATDTILERSNIIHPDKQLQNFVDDLHKNLDNATEYYYQGRTVKNIPFTEEFDPNDVVNKGISSDFLIEDELKIKQEEQQRNKTEIIYIPKSELSALITDNPMIQFYTKDDTGNIVQLHNGDNNNKISYDLYGLKDNEMIEIAIPIGRKIKSTNGDNNNTPVKEVYGEEYDDWQNNQTEQQDIKEDKYRTFSSVPQYGEEYSETYYQTDEEIETLREKEKIQTTLRGIKNVIDNFVKENQYVSPDDLFNDFLQENFKDYIQAKKITGNSKIKYTDKIIPEKLIENKNEQVEIADLSNELKGHKKTSVLINRNENYDITSIEIYCKCGEKTIIRFDEIENEEFNTKNIEQLVTNSSDTDIVVDATNIVPLNYDTDEIDLEQEFEN